MSKEYRAGDRAFAKVGRNLVEVRVKAKAENGWTVETRNGKTLTVKSGNQIHIDIVKPRISRSGKCISDLRSRMPTANPLQCLIMHSLRVDRDTGDPCFL